jgi:PAS domain S-box-containing protein
MLPLLTNLVSDGVIIADNNFRIVLINHRAEQLFGYSAQEVIGKPLEMFIPEDYRAVHNDRHFRGFAQAHEEQIRLEKYRGITGLAKSGSRIPLELAIGHFTGLDNFSETPGRSLSEGVIVCLRDLSAEQIAQQKIVEALRRQNLFFNSLNKVALGLLRRLELDDLLRDVLQQANRLVNTEYGFVFLETAEGDAMELRIDTGNQFQGMRLKKGEGIAGRVWESGKPLWISDYRTWIHRSSQLETAPFISVVGLPLNFDGRVRGVLGVALTEETRKFEDQEIEQLGYFAELASVALQNAHLYSQLTQELYHRTQMETALREREAHYRLVVDSALYAVIETDAEGKIIGWNPQAEKIFGWSREDALGMLMTRLILAPSNQSKVAEDEYLNIGKFVSDEPTELTGIHREGYHFPIEMAVSQLSIDQQQLFSAFVHDISERRRYETKLQEEREFALMVMNTVGQGLTVTNSDGRFVYVNPAYAQMLGYQPQDLLGKSPMDLAVQEGEVDYQKVFEQRRLGLTTSYEARLLHADGHTVYTLITGSPRFRDGEFIGSISSVIDLSERRKMELELARARDHALEISRLKSEFLAMMSHEIRTPMNGIFGMTEILMDTHLDEEQREYAQIVWNEAHNLLQIINDILDFSKIEAGKMMLEPTEFSLQGMIDTAIRLVAPRAEAKKLELTVDVSPFIPSRLNGDAGRLRQVLINLVNNAIKFTEQGSIKIRVEPVAIQRGTITLRFIVKDTGIGIPASARDLLFKSFTQVEMGPTRRFGGTGLGLAIARRLVELMSGQIDFFSQEGIGSTFWFTVVLGLLSGATASLPERTAEMLQMPNTTGAKKETTRVGQGSTILIVEDNAPHRFAVTSYLRKHGYLVDAAVDGRQAIQRVTEAIQSGSQYSVILMDLRMPDLDGFETAREIRHLETAAHQHTPILAVTADAFPDEIERCMQAGMDGYLTKPIDLAQLRQEVTRFNREKASI